MSDEKKPLPTYKIIRLEAENIKRLKAVSITPDGNLVEITGANGVGKSSVLDALWWALTGTSHVQANPIRKGEQTARIELDLGTVVVTRKFKAQDDGSYTTSITVTTPDGMLAQRPQEFLNAIVGELTMDPLEFARAKPKEQYEALKQLVSDVDFAAIEAENRADFAARTDINRDAKSAQAQADSISVPEETPDEPIDEAALLKEMEDVSHLNNEIGDANRVRAMEKQRIERMRRDAEEYSRQAIDYRKLADEADAKAITILMDADKADAALAAMPALPAPADPTEISARISHARAVNANVAKKQERARLLGIAAAKQKHSADLTYGIEKRDAEKRKAIAAAKLPVEGLGFGDEIITLNDLPFDQASDAEQLRASIAIAMSGKPRLRVLRIRDGSLLDNNSMKIVAEMADQHDCQVWLESVSSGRPGAIVIEDGAVRDNAHKVAAE